MTRKNLIAVAALGLFFMVMVLLNVKVLIGALSPVKQAYYDLSTNVLMVHTVALFAMTFMTRYLSRSNVEVMFYLFTAGTVLFCFPLYLVALEEVTNIVIGILKPVTLVGAVGLIAGWFMVLYTGITYKHKKHKPRRD